MAITRKEFLRLGTLGIVGGVSLALSSVAGARKQRTRTVVIQNFRACYEPGLRMPAACCRKRQANATKCNPATVSGSLS